MSWLCLLLLSTVLFALVHSRRHRSAVRFTYVVGKPKPKSNSKKRKPKIMLEKTITNEQKISITLVPITATGKPAKIDGKPEWTVQSGDSTVEVSEDGMTAVFVSADVPGDTLVLVEADADLGEGVKSISDIVKLTVEGALAASLGLVAGEPEPK